MAIVKAAKHSSVVMRVWETLSPFRHGRSVVDRQSAVEHPQESARAVGAASCFIFSLCLRTT